MGFYHDNNVVYEYPWPFHCATSLTKTTWAIPFLGKNYGICCYASNVLCLEATVQIGCNPIMEFCPVLKLGPQTHQLGAMYHVLPRHDTYHDTTGGSPTMSILTWQLYGKPPF